MKWDFKIVVLLVEWSSFRGGLKAGFYCTYILASGHNTCSDLHRVIGVQWRLGRVCVNVTCKHD